MAEEEATQWKSSIGLKRVLLRYSTKYWLENTWEEIICHEEQSYVKRWGYRARNTLFHWADLKKKITWLLACLAEFTEGSCFRIRRIFISWWSTATESWKEQPQKDAESPHCFKSFNYIQEQSSTLFMRIHKYPALSMVNSQALVFNTHLWGRQIIRKTLFLMRNQ